jgi:hypothetical protein
LNSILFLIYDSGGVACVEIFAKRVWIKPKRSFQDSVLRYEPWTSKYEGLISTCYFPYKTYYSLYMYVSSQIWILQWQVTFS